MLNKIASVLPSCPPLPTLINFVATIMFAVPFFLSDVLAYVSWCSLKTSSLVCWVLVSMCVYMCMCMCKLGLFDGRKQCCVKKCRNCLCCFYYSGVLSCPSSSPSNHYYYYYCWYYYYFVLVWILYLWACVQHLFMFVFFLQFNWLFFFFFVFRKLRMMQFCD